MMILRERERVDYCSSGEAAEEPVMMTDGELDSSEDEEEEDEP